MFPRSGQRPVSRPEDLRSQPASRVVPNVASFSVDQGFWYSIPPHLLNDLSVGSVVRVPLSGRRVRGWVVETVSHREGALKEVVGVSGGMPVFDRALLKTLEWAASHYIAPLSVLLAKSAPPNLPKSKRSVPITPTPPAFERHPLLSVCQAVARGQKRPSHAIVGRWQSLDWLACLGVVTGSGKSVMVVAPSAAEVEWIASVGREVLGESVVAVTGDDSDLTRAWEHAQGGSRVVVGTARVATWLIDDLAMMVVLEEGRRAMKDRQTPTLHVRDVVRRRSLIERAPCVFFGPTPSVEVLATGAEIVSTEGRPWPLVEIVDRSDEPPGSELLSDRVIAALRATSTARERSFVLTTRKMVDRLIEHVSRRLESRLVGDLESAASVVIGTERDLAGLGSMGLTVAPNADGMLLGQSYRTTEETLRQLARLANALRGGRGRRMMIQTEDPGSDLVETLRRGDPIPYLERVLVERARSGLPPSSEMIAVELRGELPADPDVQLAAMPHIAIVGPLVVEDGVRWLLQGDLKEVRSQLPRLVSKWREGGTTVRIDADPIDL